MADVRHVERIVYLIDDIPANIAIAVLCGALRVMVEECTHDPN